MDVVGDTSDQNDCFCVQSAFNIFSMYIVKHYLWSRNEKLSLTYQQLNWNSRPTWFINNLSILETIKTKNNVNSHFFGIFPGEGNIRLIFYRLKILDS